MDLTHVLFGYRQIDVLFLLTLDLKGFDTHIKDEILLMSKPLLSFRQQNSLDLDYVTRKCFFYIGFGKDKLQISGDVALSELVGSFLDFDFLCGNEMRMFGNEAQFSGYRIFLAFSGLTLREDFEGVVEHLHVVLRPADVAGEGGN